MMGNLTPTTLLAAIDSGADLRSGITVALAARLEQMCLLKDAALDWSDPEGVHKMRVASRRLRCALKDFAPYLGKRRTATSLKLVKEIAGALGSVRDFDVSTLTLAETAEKAPAAIARGIRHFADSQDGGRQQARTNLVEMLTGESLARLRDNFQVLLKAPRLSAARSSLQKGSAAYITYRGGANSIISKRLAELEEQSNSLYMPLETKPLHRMRIGAKGLRYALQLFEHCWGSQAVFFAEKVAGLQASLGKLHDCDVWIENFGQILIDDSRLPDIDSRAMVWLLRHFVKLRAKSLSRALKQWQQWEAKEIGAGVRKMAAETDSS